MCLTDLDLDLPEVAEHEEQAPHPEPHPADGRYAGVAWGRAGHPDVPAAATAG